MTFDQVHHQPSVQLLRCISGSKAYGLDTPQSDTDIKGVYCLPRTDFYGLQQAGQVNNPSNDIVYYELRRFIELLLQNNPNILELLSTPEDCVQYRHPVMAAVRPELFLSKRCQDTFAGYARSQIRKARGLNKKIFNPMEGERKSLLHYCHVLHGAGTVPLLTWLAEQGFRQEDCGLAKIPHARDLYALFHSSHWGDEQGLFSGIYSGQEANDVRLSSVPEGKAPLAWMSFNKDGYSAYCRDYKEYREWEEKRNLVRYEHTLAQGKHYDAKNMMHTFRLLRMAAEIATEQRVVVRRPDREFLLQIRNGAFSYDELVAMADEQTALIEELFRRSHLQEAPDERAINELLVAMRDRLYHGADGLA